MVSKAPWHQGFLGSGGLPSERGLGIRTFSGCGAGGSHPSGAAGSHISRSGGIHEEQSPEGTASQLRPPGILQKCELGFAGPSNI